MIRRTRKQTSPDVVADVRQQVEQAAALAGIAGQDRLDDPRLNPAVRDLADRLRDERHRQLLRDAHRRSGRQIRVLDQRAESAARALTLIQQAREATSPAHSVLALTKGRNRFVAAALAASAVLSVGAAYGLGHLATDMFDADPWVGWAAELGLSGLATLTIAYRAHLGRHGGQLSTRQRRLLLALIIVPLAVSVAGNAVAHGAVGVICSLGAAATAMLAHTMADASADAIQARARQVSATDEAELRAVALGEDLIPPAPTAPAVNDAPEGEGQGDDGETRVVLDESAETIEITDRPRPVPGSDGPDPVQAYADVMVDRIERMLRGDDGPGNGGVREPEPDPSGPAPSAGRIDDDPGHIEADGGHIGGHIGRDQRDSLTRAHEARRDAGNETRRRVAEYLAEHPDASNAQIGRELGKSESTIKRARRQLRQEQREAAE